MSLDTTINDKEWESSSLGNPAHINLWTLKDWKKVLSFFFLSHGSPLCNIVASAKDEVPSRFEWEALLKDLFFFNFFI